MTRSPAHPGLAGRILLTLNGNTGLDTITGGDGADRVSGGEAADVAGRGRRRRQGHRRPRRRPDARRCRRRRARMERRRRVRRGHGRRWRRPDPGERIGHPGRRLRGRPERRGHPLPADQPGAVHDRPRHRADRDEHARRRRHDRRQAGPGRPAGRAGRRRIGRAIGSRPATARPTRSRAAAAWTAPWSTGRTRVVDVENVDRPARSRAKIARKAKVVIRGGKAIVDLLRMSCPAGAENPCGGVVRAEQRQAGEGRRHQGAARPRQPPVPGRLRARRPR